VPIVSLSTRLPHRLARIERIALAAATLAVVSLVCLALTACGGGGGGGGGPSTTFPPPTTPPAPTAQELQFAAQVLSLVNSERVSRGIAPVANDADAAEAAFGHAFDMADRGYFDHFNPEGEDPGDRMTRAGVSWSTWGENIARGQQSPAEVMTAWMNSPDHRANILSAAFSRLGVGCYIGSGGGPWWVQDFVD